MLKFSPKRDSHLQEVHEEEYCQYEDHCANNFSTLRLFSETEETVRPRSLTSIYENYKELKKLWDWCYNEYKDKEAKTRIHHVQSQMQTFEYFFFNWDLLFFSLGMVITWINCYMLKICVPRKLRKLWKNPQSPKKMRYDEKFELLSKDVQSKPANLCINPPKLPRKEEHHLDLRNV